MTLVGLVAGSLRADDKAAPSTFELPARVETRHTINLPGKLPGQPLDYRAVAETIGLTDQKGEATASVYTVSYLADTPAGQPPGRQRAVAFVFNGGPGAASVFLHLGGLEPRILDTPASGAVPSPPVQLVDNPSTWLTFT